MRFKGLGRLENGRKNSGKRRRGSRRAQRFLVHDTTPMRRGDGAFFILYRLLRKFAPGIPWKRLRYFKSHTKHHE